MKEGGLLYFPDGAARMTRHDRLNFGSSSQLAEPLVAVDTVVKVKSIAGKNVTLQSAERQLQGPVHGRFETEGQFSIKEITRFSLPLTTFEELTNSKESILYQTWRQSQELRRVLVPVEIFVGATLDPAHTT